MPQDAEKLASYVRSLPDFKFVAEMDRYNHMGAIVADAVLQAHAKYKTVVKPRVDRIINQYPKADTTSSVLEILSSTDVTTFLDWNGTTKSKRFRQVIDLFKTEGVENESELKEWLSQDSNLPKLRDIIGIGPKTVDYFKILVGIPTCAIDQHLLSFLKLAGISPKDYVEAKCVINATADNLAKDRALFDHSIWRYMSEKESEEVSNMPEPSLELLMQLLQKVLDNQREMREDIREIKNRLGRLDFAPPKPSILLDFPA